MEEHRFMPDTEEAGQDNRIRTAAYIAELARELETLARREKIEPLSRLLQIAHEEARRIAFTN